MVMVMTEGAAVLVVGWKALGSVRNGMKDTA